MLLWSLLRSPVHSEFHRLNHVGYFDIKQKIEYTRDRNVNGLNAAESSKYLYLDKYADTSSNRGEKSQNHNENDDYLLVVVQTFGQTHSNGERNKCFVGYNAKE